MREVQTKSMDIGWDCILRDILSQWWMILISGISAFLITVSLIQLNYQPRYTAESTFVIGRSGFTYQAISENLGQAETICRQYTQITGSSILQKEVCKELGMDTFDADIHVETVQSTNLMVFRVTADSPRMSYLISRSVIQHAVSLMASFLNDVTIQELQQTQIPEGPSNPMHNLRWGRNAGLIAMAAMILLLGWMSILRDTVRNMKDAMNKIDARLLGTIDYEKKRHSLLLTTPVLSLRYVEANHMLSSRIRLSMDRFKKKVLMVTSVAENEGKSTIAANLAISLAQNGSKVLLADCDFRKPSQYKIFSEEGINGPDFTEIIKNEKTMETGCIQKIPGLLTFFTKKDMQRPWNKKEYATIAKMIEQMKQYVDYIILDTSPAALISDTEEYAALADAALIVIRQNTTEVCYINDTIDDLNDAGTKVIGCVLNSVQKKGIFIHE